MRIAFTFLLFVVVCVAQAHEFWMQPNKHRLKLGEELMIAFSQGDDLVRIPWQITKSNIKSVTWCWSDDSAELRDKFVEGTGANVSLKMTSSGTHLFKMQTLPFVEAWSADSFNEYLKADGHDDILFNRQKANLTDSVKETVSIFSKLLVEVGGESDRTFRLQTSTPLEIIPLENPYELKIGDRIRFMVNYRGKPHFGGQVKILNRHASRTTVQKIYTQKDGIVETTLSNRGNWLVRVAVVTAVKGNEKQYETFVCTLNFGV